MEPAVCVSGFVLLISITGVHLSPDPELTLVIGHEEGIAKFNTWIYLEDDYELFDDHFVLYRVGEDGDLLLINCSQPDTPQPDGYQLKCINDSHLYFEMNILSMSQSGDYRAEGWRGGNITEHRSFRLIVCAEGDEDQTQFPQFEENEVTVGESAVLCRLNSTLGHGSSLQLYRYDWPGLALVLDTNSSLEPLVEDLRGRLQVDLNTSQVTLSAVTNRDREFYCTVWRGAQCQSYSKRILRVFTEMVFAYEEVSLTFPCTSNGELPGQVYWSTPIRRVQTSMNQTLPQEVMYMLNGSQNGDYSLIIPSVAPQHCGSYECSGRRHIRTIHLYVCIKPPPPTDVMFSHGESVWVGTVHFNRSWRLGGVQWYRQKALQPQVLIVHYWDERVRVQKDLRGRVTELRNPSNHSLIISNLTAEDSGVYTWRAHGGYPRAPFIFCYEGSFRLVYRDPFGVHSPFYRAYAPLIGCVLLGLVAAVIWFKLRSRRGEQTSGRQSREGQQSGDEDLYDEVEMVQLNT